MSRAAALRTLRHPASSVLGIALGAILGLAAPGAALRASLFGDVFLSSLKMCVLPIVITSVVLSVVRLFRSHEAAAYLSAMLGVFVAGSAAAGLLGIAIGGLSAGWLLADERVSHVLSELVGGQAQPATGSGGTLTSFVAEVVPQNIFHSLSEGQILSILFFFVLFGMALAGNRKESGAVVLHSLEALNEAFFQMIGWLVYLLPFGFFAIFAGTFARFGAQLMSAVGALILVCALACLPPLAAYAAAIVSVYGRRGARKALGSLKDVLFIAFGTSSSLAAMPSALTSLKEGFGVDPGLCDLVLPLGVTLNAQGSALFYCLITVFVARIYALPIGFREVALIVGGAVLRGLTAAGMPAVASLPMMALLFRPLGIPAETVSVLLLAILPLLDPMLTMTNMAGNCACAVVIERVVSKRSAP